MKKGIVVVLLALALVLLVSPGIIGRLAERSVEQGFDWASRDNGEIIVSSTGFDRGWFTSAGQHRVELREGELYYLLLGAVDDLATGPFPALLIDTRLDHGLIPVTSMRRDNGSLMPGLGNAVSTVSLELADGTVVPLPGTLYSTVGLTGELKSRFTLHADSFDGADARLAWGDAEFLLTSDARSGSLSVKGALQSLAVESETGTTNVGPFDVDVALVQSGHGYMVGPFELTLESFAIRDAAESMTAGPFYMRGDSSVDDGRLNMDLTIRIDNAPLPLGNGALDVVARLENVDAAALGHFKRSVDASRVSDYEQMADVDLEGDTLRLLAGGMALHFDQMDLSGPYGQLTSRISATLAQSPPDKFGWAGALLALDASADVSLPIALIDDLAQGSSELRAAIEAGFLQRKSDYYVMRAAFRQGLLTVNGAPMPIPLPRLQ